MSPRLTTPHECADAEAERANNQSVEKRYQDRNRKHAPVKSRPGQHPARDPENDKPDSYDRRCNDAGGPKPSARSGIEDQTYPQNYGKTAHDAEAPLDRRVAITYSIARPVNPGQGIGLPVSKGAARATRPVWARFFMVGRVASTARCAVPLAVRPIVARPATSIGLLRPDVFKGKRP